MQKAESLSQHLRRLVIGWSLFAIVVTIPLGLISYYVFEFVDADADFNLSAEAVVSAHRSQILVGDTRAVELQIRKELRLGRSDTATFVDVDFQRWLSEFDSVSIKSCTPAGSVCRNWARHSLRTFHPIYFDEQKSSLWGYLYVERNPPTNWTLAITVAAVFLLGMMVQIFGMYANLSRTMNRIGKTLSDWSSHLLTDSKAGFQRGRPPFAEFEPIESALAQLNFEISQLQSVAREEGALQTLRGFGHDILNPVSRMKRILGAAENESSGGGIFLDRELYCSLDANLRRLSGYAEQLKALYKKNIGESHRESNVTNISECVSAVVSELSFDPIVMENGIVFELRIDSDCFGQVSPSSVGRAVENLCSNAIHASKPHGVIQVGVSKDSSKVQIYVRDQGCGIPIQLRNYIFDAGFTSKANKGTGLGLFVVKKICDESHGQVKFESEIGIGTSFEIEFPQARVYELQNTVS
jgi:signal transduction histidine kinase